MNDKTTITYAQYNEDIILDSLLSGVKDGFYIDIGANYEETDSVTKLFYERGWRGVNVEPIKSLYEDLLKKRPKDINLNLGIGMKSGVAKFREYEKLSGHSTFRKTQKLAHTNSKYKDYNVPVITLNELYKKYKFNKVHFLKVDVEGFEYEVLAGNDWGKNRPEVLCIEANHVDKDWRSMLTTNNYKLVVMDGLNEYYLAEESKIRFDNFTEIAVQNNYYALQKHYYDSWKGDRNSLIEARKRVEILEKSNSDLLDEVEKFSYNTALSLRGVSFIRRLKRAAYGMTVDLYYYYKRK